VLPDGRKGRKERKLRLRGAAEIALDYTPREKTGAASSHASDVLACRLLPHMSAGGRQARVWSTSISELSADSN